MSAKDLLDRVELFTKPGPGMQVDRARYSVSEADYLRGYQAGLRDAERVVSEQDIRDIPYKLFDLMEAARTRLSWLLRDRGPRL